MGYVVGGRAGQVAYTRTSTQVTHRTGGQEGRKTRRHEERWGSAKLLSPSLGQTGTALSPGVFKACSRLARRLPFKATSGAASVAMR